jgi:hypothetical protein
MGPVGEEDMLETGTSEEDRLERGTSLVGRLGGRGMGQMANGAVREKIKIKILKLISKFRKID